MADMNEKEIMQRFEMLKHLKPDGDASQAAVDKTRAAIMQCNEGDSGVSKRLSFKSYVFKFAVAACLAAAVLAGFSLLTNDEVASPEIAKVTGVSLSSEDTVKIAADDKKDSHSDIEKLFAAGDVKGLLALLDDESEKVRAIAAGFLGKLGAIEAIEKLTELSLAFNGEGDDPYMLAIAEIEDELAKQQAELADAEQAKTEEAKADEETEEEEEEEMVRMFTVSVVNKATSEPVEGVLIKLDVFSTDRWVKNIKEGLTDATGHAVFDFDTDWLVGLYVGAEKPGYTSKSYYTTEAWRLKDIKDFKILLEEGVEIGGVVVNEQNEPVAGANIAMRIISVSPGTLTEPVRDFRPIKSDANGRWSVRAVLSDIKNIHYKLEHPEYVDDKYDIKLISKHTEEQVVAKAMVFVMLKGNSVSGYVYDSSGSPVAGAEVFDGELFWVVGSEYRYNDELRDQTDAAGMFELHNVGQNTMLLTVEAEGYGPYAKNTDVSAGSGPIEIVLEKGSVIYGRAVDGNGEPIEGANISNEQWNREAVPVKWQTKSGADGRFVWENAPTAEVNLLARQTNYYDVVQKVIADPETEYEFVMYPGLVVTGNVYDAATDEPVTNFEFIPGFGDSSDGQGVSYYANVYWAQKFDAGNYRYVATHGDTFGFRINAEGYATSESPIFYAEEEEVRFDVYLEKAGGREGMVYDGQGDPVAGADVYVSSKEWGFRFKDFQNTNGLIHPIKTDADGKFSFRPKDENYLIIAMHSEKGFVEVYSEDFESSQAIYLSKWGKIEGYAYIGSEPAAGAEIVVNYRKNYDQEGRWYRFEYSLKADAEGKFSVDKVIADEAANGRTIAARVVAKDGRNSDRVDIETVEILADETAYVVLGGNGRKVTGNMVKPAGYSGGVTWTASHGNINSANYPAEAYRQLYKEVSHPLPAEYDSMSAVQVVAWLNQWQQSAEGKEFQSQVEQRLQELSGYSEAKNNSYRAVVFEDGKFEAYNVTKGDYEIVIVLYATDMYGRVGYSNPIGRSDFRFTMPEVTDDNIDVTLDVGTVAIKATAQLGVGKPITGVEFKDYNGNSIDMNGYRDKLLLLNFWDLSWAGRDAQNSGMDTIKQLQDKYAGDDNIEMLGITASNGSWSFYDGLRLRYLDEKGITFKQATVEFDQALSRLLAQSGFEYPINILIDTNGIVIGAGLKGQELEDAVAGALGY